MLSCDRAYGDEVLTIIWWREPGKSWRLFWHPLGRLILTYRDISNLQYMYLDFFEVAVEIPGKCQSDTITWIFKHTPLTFECYFIALRLHILVSTMLYITTPWYQYFASVMVGTDVKAIIMSMFINHLITKYNIRMNWFLKLLRP